MFQFSKIYNQITTMRSFILRINPKTWGVLFLSIDF